MTLRQSRRFIGETMESMGKGNTSVDIALTQSKLAGRIIESYNVELRGIELAAKLSNTPFTYAEALLQIETQEDNIVEVEQNPSSI